MSHHPVRAARGRRLAHALAATAGMLAIAAAQVLTGAPQSAHAATQVGATWTFGFTGSTQQFQVPDNVDVLTMIVTGAAGAGAVREGEPIGQPGKGGMVVAQVSVDPGSWLTVWVGGTPEDSQRTDRSGWGFGCGGPGGLSPDASGGSGGGGSAVTLGQVDTSDCITEQADTYHPLVVAGGGGGAGSASGDDGGNGGNGGHTPADGQGDNGGCGGCNSIPGGSTSGAGSGHHAGGGGGGGYGGGGAGDPDTASGGGGGYSWVTDTSPYLYYRDGVSADNGSVTLIAGASQSFNCKEEMEEVFVPEGATKLRVYAIGGGGGSHKPGSGRGGIGGSGGVVTADVLVEEYQHVQVGVGCPGGDHGGWGGAGAHGGDRGDGHNEAAVDGMGGGGASVVMIDGGIVVVAGGGGGAGGRGTGIWGESPSGDGGNGGRPATSGHFGWSESPFFGGGADGGCGGCRFDHAGGEGGSSSWATEGGGGGGGGGGFYGGGGGQGGRPDPTDGGGGGGGASYVGQPAIGTPQYDVAPGSGPGFVYLTWIAGNPATMSAHGGGGQTAAQETAFSEPLSVLVTDEFGHPWPGVGVTFDVSGADGEPHGHFDGGATSATTMTDDNGIAASPAVFANDVTGSWTARATSDSVPGGVATFRLTNQKMPTTTTVSVDPTSALAGSPTTFRSTVAPAEVSGGFVSFSVDGADPVSAPLVAGQAEYHDVPSPDDRSTWLPAGPHTLTASYPGNAYESPSSASTGFTVTAIPTTVTLHASMNPAPPGVDVSFQATIGVPAGSPLPVGNVVTFTVDGTPIGTGTVGADGTAHSPAVTLDEGERTIAAVLAGDEYFDEGIGYLTEVVQPEGTVVRVSTSPSVSEYEQSVLYTAVVFAADELGTPVGTVTFLAGDLVLCSAELESGLGSCSSAVPLDPGVHTVLGVYESSSPEFANTAGRGAHTVAKVPTELIVSADPSSATPFESIAVTADVDWSGLEPGDDPGSVQFSVDGEPYGDPVPVVDGVAAPPPLTGLAVGTHSIVAHYLGTGFFAGSTATTTVTIAPVATTVALTSSDDPSDPREAVTFGATVTGDGLPAQGAVQFRVDGVDLGHPIPLDETGSATSPPVDWLGSGEHQVVASFIPATASFLPGHAALAQEVREATITTLTASSGVATTRTHLVLTATVEPLIAGAAITDGTVTFSSDGELVDGCIAVPLSDDGTAECRLPLLTEGVHEFVASYSGGAETTASSATLSRLIHPADDGPLPVTGAQAAPALATGAILLIGGALALLLTRRRRTTRTAER